MDFNQVSVKYPGSDAVLLSATKRPVKNYWTVTVKKDNMTHNCHATDFQVLMLFYMSLKNVSYGRKMVYSMELSAWLNALPFTIDFDMKKTLDSQYHDTP